MGKEHNLLIVVAGFLSIRLPYDHNYFAPGTVNAIRVEIRNLERIGKKIDLWHFTVDFSFLS